MDNNSDVPQSLPCATYNAGHLAQVSQQMQTPLRGYARVMHLNKYCSFHNDWHRLV